MFFEHTIQQHTFEFWIGHSDKVKQQLIITKVRFIAVIYVHAWYHKCNCKRAFLSSELLLEAKLWSSSVCLPFCILLIATAGKKTKMDPFWMFIFEIIYFATPKIYLFFVLSLVIFGNRWLRWPRPDMSQRGSSLKGSNRSRLRLSAVWGGRMPTWGRPWLRCLVNMQNIIS